MVVAEAFAAAQHAVKVRNFPSESIPVTFLPIFASPYLQHFDESICGKG
jgi:hypothetical protein